VKILGMGQISGAGYGLESLIPRAHNVSYRSTITQKGELKIPVLAAPDPQLPDFVPASVQRRLSRCSKLFIHAVAECLRVAQSKGVNTPPERIGLIIGTVFGCLDLANQFQKRISLEGPAGASPSTFAGSIHNSIASHLTIFFNIQGPNSTLSTMEATTQGAFQMAQDWLRSKRVDRVIVAIGDEISEYHPYLMGHLSPADPQTFDPLLSNFNVIPGEGVAAFLLGRDSDPAESDLELHAPSLWRHGLEKQIDRFFIAAYGNPNNLEDYKRLLNGVKLESFGKIYGSVLTGSAFDIMCASTILKKDQTAACIQIPSHHEAQTELQLLILKKLT
jgi:hypothetical protein